MKIAKLYDRISASYDLTDRFIVNSQCRTFALNQINGHHKDLNSSFSVVDLGVGDGEFLRLLHSKYPNVKLTGVDIADKMLELARKKLEITTINAPLNQVDQVLTQNAFDVIIAHFVLAYVELDKLLPQCHKIQKDNGVLSIITTTFESFSEIRQQLSKNIPQHKLIGGVGNYLYQRAINKTLVPKSFDEIKEKARKQGYEVIGRQTLFEEVYFNNVEELAKFGIKGGWFITAIDYPYIPFFVLNFFAKIFAKLFLTFPISDCLNIEVVLLRKL